MSHRRPGECLQALPVVQAEHLVDGGDDGGVSGQFEGKVPSLQGSTPERGHLALETEPRNPMEGGAPSLQSPGARATRPRLESGDVP